MQILKVHNKFSVITDIECAQRIVYFNRHYIYIVLIFLAFGVYCQNVIGRETRDIYIGLDKDGNFADNTTNLVCSNERKIVLLQNRFLLLECASLDQCQTISTSPLLPEEELVLHRKCSLQTRCENLKFPLRPETKTANAMHIKYECIGKYNNKMF